MTLTWLWVRSEFRLRWRSLAMLALLMALSSAVVLTALAGARRSATEFEATWLLGFGVAAAVASALLTGQAIARHTATTARGLAGLGAVGMTGAQHLRMAAAAPIVAGATGVALGVVSAAITSRWFPIGSAADVEPAPGFAPDLLVLGAGAVLTLVFCVLVTVLPVVAVRSAGQLRLPSHPSAVAQSASRSGLPVPAVIGTRFALESARRSVVRPGLLGGVIGVTGVLAALVLGAAVTDAAREPARFGETWRLFTVLGSGGTDIPAASQALDLAARDPGVSGTSDTRVGSGELGRPGHDGQVSAAVFSYGPGRTPLSIVVTRGSAPMSASDVVLGPRTASRLGVEPGDDVTLTGTADGSRTMQVTGLGFVPNWIGSTYAEGAWLTSTGFSSAYGSDYDDRIGLLALDPGADREAVQQRLGTAFAGLGPDAEGIEVERTDRPVQMDEIGRISRLPLLLGVFLGLLALGAVGHALVTVTRRRQHDLAVLRALGMTRPQVRAAVATQATVLGVIGLIFGIPLGLALGRTIWRTVADFMPLQYRAPMSLSGVLLTVAAVLVLGLVLSVVPGQRAVRLRVADLLRAE